ncbi:hypothetical protein DV736_g5985, partial [Chaetothyriales sp. CBS 134916]
MAFRNDNVSQPTIAEVAICGIGLRLPGGIRNCDDFWDVLENGKDTRSAIPSTRYNIEGFDDSLGGKDAIKIKHGYFLDEDLSRLDTTFFSLAKNELEKMDPQQRLLLEVVRESLEDAGEVNYRGQQVGCYVGTFGEDWLMMSAKDPQQGGGYLITGHGDLMLANRISMLIKTGCSSSLLGLHEAFRAIQKGDANAAIVAGASMIITPTITATMSAGDLLAIDGSCKSFDAAADGYARAEAVVAVYIKRLSDAIRDGNPIRAIIKGTATNCDGRSQSLVTPNGAAQEDLIRKAYEDAGLNPQDTPFIECHGTGTPLGDPIETTAVGRVFGARGVFIGSVVKSVLALEHKIIPPNIKFNTPNPKIPFAQYRLTVPVVPTPFPQDRPERVSINSFGIGGTNAHAILESSPQIPSIQDGMETQGRTATTNETCLSKPELLLFSANTQTSLDEQICRHKKWILATQVSVADVAYTRAVHREHLPSRAFSIVDNRDFVESASGVKTPQTADPVVLVFSGQGAQWPGMGKELVLDDTEFRNDILKMDRALQLLTHPPQWNMVDEILKPDSSSQIHRAELSQPICTAIQVALFNKFAALGVKPRAVVGHSSGEIAAAYAAGYISMNEAITTAYYRGYVATNSTLKGAMAAIGLGSLELSGCLVDGVVVACENSPKSSTLSGDADQVRRAVGLIKQKMPDVFTRMLKVDQAYHSLESTETEPQWRNLLQIEDEPWLADHKIQSNIVFPFAGYVALAGEAVRQLTHSLHDVGYHLRHVVAHTALSLSESVPTELFTTLHQEKLNDHEESGWFDFSITSYNGSRWIKHCDGLVRIGRERTPSASAPKLLSRNINCSQFYENMAKVGFMYGPEFRGLTNMTASATDEAANGQIINRNTDSRAPFTLHPAVIDAGLQLLLVAKIKGLSRNIIELCLPTSIDEMEIGPASDVMDAKAWNLYGNKEFPCVECISDGKLVLHASGVEFRPLSDDKAFDLPDPHATARLRWLPDFDFVDKSTLFVPPTIGREVTQLQEELALFCILESAERVRCLEPCQLHYAKYRDWMDQQISLAAAGNYKLVKNSSEYVKLSSEQRLEAINNLTNKLMEKRNTAFTVGLRRIFDNIDKIFTGEVRVLDVLLRDNVLAKIYDIMTFDYAKFVRLLAHARPNLRILEVGAGTGGTTETITRSLVDVGGLPVYSTYTFTDISAGFFPSARERFAHVSNMEFKVFDVTKDPAEQGLQAGSYDLVLAANVLHATPSIRNTLVNVEKLLMPDGMLVMTEICQVSWRSNYIFGNFAGWWLGEADGRPDQPYISLSRWDEELKAVGFTGVDMAMHEAADPYRQFAVITSRKQAKEKTKPTKVSVMSTFSAGEVACSLAAALQERGWEATIFSLTDELPQDGDIISCVDLETNFFEDLSANTFIDFQSLLGSMGSKKLLWLTRPVQMNCRDPQTAQSIGVARTIRSELGLNFSTLEIDVNEEHFSSLVASVFNKVCAGEDKGSLESDKEFAVDNSVVYIGRYHPFSVINEMPKSSDGCQTHLVKYLDIETPGMLDTLTWKAHLIPETITEDHVEINVRSAGLNFRDVVYAMGLLVYKESRAPLGMEVAGTVRRVGSAVTAFAVCDRVMSFTNCNGFSTQLVVPDHSVLKIPENMTFEEAATIPGCFSTVIQALLDVGRLRKGMSVLIHSACGGVGLAAIQVAQMVGAEIFASVGTEKKVEHLIAKYNIPRDHIFTSRNLSFLEGVMEQTSGKGVDLVLNSLKGDLLHASWKCVAKNGKLLELGKRDLADHGQLDMSRFLDNRSYCGVDLAHLVQEEPLVVRDILQRALDFYEKGWLKPLDPITMFDAVDVEDAFRYLQAGEHIGIARCSAIEKGAKYLVFLSRNAGNSASSAFAAELESMGCSTAMIKGSVNNIKDVKEAIRLSPAPIRGVFHLAMVQRDSSFLDMKWMDWVDANKPKVKGTWNLHEAFLGHPLDFFWLASSLVTVVDQPGQGNYKAGCTFIEAFCQYRHSLGLPASVLCICPIDDVGYVAENPHALRASKIQGLHFCGEREFLDCVEFSILNQSPKEAERHNDVECSYRTPWTSSGQLIMGLRSELHLDDPKNPTNWRRDRRMGLYHNTPVKEESKLLSESKGLKQLLQNLQSGNAEGTLMEESVADFIAVEIGRKVNDFLLKRHAKIDVSLTPSEMGLDSLTAIELRRWFRQILGLQISVLRIMESASLTQLGQNVADMLKEKYTS